MSVLMNPLYKRWQHLRTQCVSLIGWLLISPCASAAEPYDFDMASSVGALMLVIALILLLAWLLKRMQIPGIGQHQGLRVVRQLAVGSKERIAVIEVGEEQFLVGITPHNIQTLAKLEHGLSDDHAPLSPFAEQLRQLVKKNDKK